MPLVFPLSAPDFTRKEQHKTTQKLNLAFWRLMCNPNGLLSVRTLKSSSKGNIFLQLQSQTRTTTKFRFLFRFCLRTFPFRDSLFAVKSAGSNLMRSCRFYKFAQATQHILFAPTFLIRNFVELKIAFAVFRFVATTLTIRTGRLKPDLRFQLVRQIRQNRHN